LRVNDAQWSSGRREAFQKIVSGEAAADDLLLIGGQGSITCKTVAWLQRAETRPSLAIPGECFEQMQVQDLRDEIRANGASFPAQVPVFPSCPWQNVQAGIAQLYFVLGWSIAAIAERYGISRQQARRILNEWKSRAVRAGYIQQIPPDLACPIRE